jgi:phage tail sheath protein FI
VALPGIYSRVDPVVPPPLAVANAAVAGFVGIAERGPVGAPTRLTDWQGFIATFGCARDGYLADAVRGFFANGGDACWVVRVARDATAAELVLADGWGNPSLRVYARDEGTWGNAIAVTCRRITGAEALVVRDIELGACEAYVASARGFAAGAMARIHGRGGVDHVVLVEVGDRMLRWAPATPIDHGHLAAAPTRIEVIGFELTAALGERRELFGDLQLDPRSPRHAPRVVARASALIRVESVATTTAMPHAVPVALAATRLAGGRDGTMRLGADDLVGRDRGPADRSGLAALVAVDEVGVIAVPDAMWLHDRAPGPVGELAARRVQDELVAACERREDRFAIVDIPRSTDVEWVRRWRRRTDSSYAAFYWPWLEVAGVADGLPRAVPPSGHLAGCYARRDRDGVHFAPANLAIAGAQDVALRLGEDHALALDGDAVNTFRIQRGIRPWGARTAAEDPAWRHVSVRRLFVMLRRSIDAGFAWIAFEPNDARTWSAVRERIAAFLGELHATGALAGKTPEDAFYVRCDAETNPADQVARGVLRCEIGVAPLVPAEFLTIILEHATAVPVER